MLPWLYLEEISTVYSVVESELMTWRIFILLLALAVLSSCATIAEQDPDSLPEEEAASLDQDAGASAKTKTQMLTVNSASTANPNSPLIEASAQSTGEQPPTTPEAEALSPTSELATPGTPESGIPQPTQQAQSSTPVSPPNGLQEMGSVPPPAPSILSFQADVSEANPGDTVILEWETAGADMVTLWHLMPTGQLGRWWEVPASGQFEYTILERERNSTRFALNAIDDADQSEMATLSIRLFCPDAWFFQGAPEICPADAPLISAAAYQVFERGIMIWNEEEDQVYILFGDGGSPGWTRHLDRWEIGMPDLDSQLQAPPGYYQPVRGFGLVWREEPGVRERLGWGLADEIGYEATIQRTSYAKYNETYISAADGRVWRLLPERSGWAELDPD